MKTTLKCPKCDSTDIISDASAIDHSYGGTLDLTIANYRKPTALIFKGERNTTVSVWVCTGCGFVEFYADHPKNLKFPEQGS